MIIYVLALLVLLLGLWLMAIAYLSAHRTFIPAFKSAPYLWWPGIGLLVVSMLIALAPSLLRYGQCQTACDVIGGTAEHAFAENVSTDYENCVNSGVNEIRRNILEQMKDGATGLDPDRSAADAEPGVREVCRDMVTSQCVAVCYNPQVGEEGASEDE